ncbi:hypothetical protein SAMN05216588_101128 [Pseudomonas flavescens]|uniref:Uncharacterized protein n=1 Tax=Phytopseudomonas flavescens TaxID=29435 RepID=A0A1G7XHJ6_9GAMM|nr:hypothetical protein [Pseudomonas flavescens]SDG83614.1 hypothetical protein SAMN05216588_101128 [Pseudomonas flavescens]
MRVDVPVSLHSGASVSVASTGAVVDTLVEANESADGEVVQQEGVRVTLSADGLARAANTDKEKSKDIDDSNLPDVVKQILKMIRQLKAQLAEKMAELQAMMTDQSLAPEARQAQAQALQTEVGSISSALSGANAQLAKVMREQGVSSEQGAAVAALMSA